eukprot:2849494-Rhodomonas_salina.1
MTAQVLRPYCRTTVSMLLRLLPYQSVYASMTTAVPKCFCSYAYCRTQQRMLLPWDRAGQGSGAGAGRGQEARCLCSYAS